MKTIIPWTEEKMPGATLCSASYFIPITKKSFREIYKYIFFSPHLRGSFLLIFKNVFISACIFLDTPPMALTC